MLSVTDYAVEIITLPYFSFLAYILINFSSGKTFYGFHDFEYSMIRKHVNQEVHMIRHYDEGNNLIEFAMKKEYGFLN